MLSRKRSVHLIPRKSTKIFFPIGFLNIFIGKYFSWKKSWKLLFPDQEPILKINFHKIVFRTKSRFRSFVGLPGNLGVRCKMFRCKMFRHKRWDLKDLRQKREMLDSFQASLGDLYYKMVSPLLSPLCPRQEHIFQLTHLKDPFKVTENQSQANNGKRRETSTGKLRLRTHNHLIPRGGLYHCAPFLNI